METAFLNALNSGITAGYIISAVILLRFLLKKSPKWISLVLWGFVAIRLICPFSFESIFSIIPSAKTVSPDIVSDYHPSIQSGINVIDNTVNPIIYNVNPPAPVETAVTAPTVSPLQIITSVASVVWIVGIIALTIYAITGYVSLRRRVATAVIYKENIWKSDFIDTPFILGFFRPKIYIPFGINEAQYQCIISHEKSHIKHCDHILKPIGFFLLTAYWFNPLVWAAYILFCRDIELACDERVVKNMDKNSRKSYASALLECSIENKKVSAYPLAFGETGVKTRVKNVINYKKATLLVVVFSIISCFLLSACLLTNPVSDGTSSDAVSENSVDIPMLTSNWFQSADGNQPGTDCGVLKFNDDKTGIIRFTIGDGKTNGFTFEYEVNQNGKILLTPTGELDNENTVKFPEEWKEMSVSFEPGEGYGGKPMYIMNVTLQNGDKIKYFSEQYIPMDIKDVSSFITSEDWYESGKNDGNALIFNKDGTGSIKFAENSKDETIKFNYKISEYGKISLTSIGQNELPDEWKEIWVGDGFLFGELNSLDLTLKNGDEVSYYSKQNIPTDNVDVVISKITSAEWIFDKARTGNQPYIMDSGKLTFKKDSTGKFESFCKYNDNSSQKITADFTYKVAEDGKITLTQTGKSDGSNTLPEEWKEISVAFSDNANTMAVTLLNGETAYFVKKL